MEDRIIVGSNSRISQGTLEDGPGGTSSYEIVAFIVISIMFFFILIAGIIKLCFHFKKREILTSQRNRDVKYLSNLEKAVEKKK